MEGGRKREGGRDGGTAEKKQSSHFCFVLLKKRGGGAGALENGDGEKSFFRLPTKRCIFSSDVLRGGGGHFSHVERRKMCQQEGTQIKKYFPGEFGLTATTTTAAAAAAAPTKLTFLLTLNAFQLAVGPPTPNPSPSQAVGEIPPPTDLEEGLYPVAQGVQGKLSLSSPSLSFFPGFLLRATTKKFDEAVLLCYRQ